MSEEESKKLFRRRKYDEIENDEIINYSKDSQESELQKDSNIHKFEMRKRMLKFWSDDADILIKQNRKSTLTDLQLEKWCDSDFFTDEITDESSEFSIESDDILNNATTLTSLFRIIPSGIDGNCLFHTLNNIIFGRQLTAKSIRDEICDFIFKMKEIYRHICDGDLDNHITWMRSEGYWGTNLELLAFSDLMRLNINIHFIRSRLSRILDLSSTKYRWNKCFPKKLEILWRLAITWWIKRNSDK